MSGIALLKAEQAAKLAMGKVAAFKKEQERKALASRKMPPEGKKELDSILWAKIDAGNCEEIKRLLRSGATVDARRYGDYWTPLMRAAHKGHKEIVELLIANSADVNAHSNNKFTALIFASETGRTEIAGMLLAAGADPDKETSQGWTALKKAAHKGHTEAVALLLDGGADVNQGHRASYGSKKKTALDCAVELNRSDIIELLKSRGGKLGSELP